MLNVLLVGLVAYLLTSFLGYIIHWAIHRPWAGKAYRAHRAHHVDLYPPGKLISDTYRSAGQQSTVYTFVMAFAPLLLIPPVLWITGVFTFGMALSAVLAMGISGLLNDTIHDSYHVKDHWLGRVVPGYDRMRQLHFIHHVNMRKNYGIYSFVWDRIFGTLKIVYGKKPLW
jgi:sterol desaturase/sphingolipid hydroxylase (fatty acid hydroxylase superfamily)